jgi:hypothetical protein
MEPGKISEYIDFVIVWTAKESVFDSRLGQKIFFFSIALTPVLESTQLPTQ